jgi:predicted PurR-regulated permease PerM
MTQIPESPSWNRDTKILVTIIALLVIVALVYIARPVIPQLILAIIVAYILQPLIDWLARHRVPRGIAAALGVLLVVVIVALFPILLIPAIVSGVRAIADTLVQLPSLSQGWLDSLVASNPTLVLPGGRTLELAELVTSLLAEAQVGIDQFEMPEIRQLIEYVAQGAQAAGGILSTAAGIASGVASAFLGGVFLIFATFYLSKDGDQFGSWLNGLFLPEYRPEMQELGRQLNLVWKSFFRGQILLSLTVGTLVFIVTTILGLPGSLVLGILAGVLEVIPNLGPILAMIPAIVLAFIQGPTYLPVSNLVFALIVLLAYFLIQQLENNVLVPRIMGASLHLHPVVVLAGVFAGASFAGVLGAFLAAPVLASLKLLGQYVHAKISGHPPFVTPAVVISSPGEAGMGRGLLRRLRGQPQSRPPAANDAPGVEPVPSADSEVS